MLEFYCPTISGTAAAESRALKLQSLKCYNVDNVLDVLDLVLGHQSGLLSCRMSFYERCMKKIRRKVALVTLEAVAVYHREIFYEVLGVWHQPGQRRKDI